MQGIYDFLYEIFDEIPIVVPTNRQDLQKLTLNECVSHLNTWLNAKLSEHETEAEKHKNEQQYGRLGPQEVLFDTDDARLNATLINVTTDKLTVQSQAPFATIRANCCVFAGKWMYEVQLKSKGVMQIGWCSAMCRFTHDTGVGDTRHSYGLDGSKQRVWHVYTRKYGPYWRSGDIIGVCLDMDQGTVTYYRNGVCLGQAFDDVERGPGIALFPAASLAFNDSLTANFGGAPFRHPVAGYKPLQQKPKIELMHANHLLHYLVNLARVISQQKGGTVLNSEPSVSLESVELLIASIIVGRVGPLLRNAFVIEDKIYSYIRGMCVIRSDVTTNTVVHPGQPESILGTFLDLLWTFLDEEDVTAFLVRLINYIGSCYKETPIDLEYEKQRTVIVILTCICNHAKTRKYLLEYKFFEKNCLPLFLYIKPPDEVALEKLLPDDCIWTEGIGGNKLEYNLACDRLKQATAMLYTLQKNLILVLMNNKDGGVMEASSRKIFMAKFRKYVMDDSVEVRNHNILNSTTVAPTQPAVALSFLCILLDITKGLFRSEVPEKPVHVQPKHFYDDSFCYKHFDRVGGIVSHLKKTFRRELAKSLGESHPVLVKMKRPEPQATFQIQPMVTVLRMDSSTIVVTSDRGVVGSSGGTENGNRRSTTSNPFGLSSILGSLGAADTSEPLSRKVTSGNLNTYESLNEMLDCAIFYYYTVAHKYIVMIADLRDNIALLSNILLETKECSDDILAAIEDIKSIKSTTKSSKASGSGADAGEMDDIATEIANRFGQRKSVFAKRSMELARKQAWYRSVALGGHRRSLLCWLLKAVFESLQAASKERELFAFVPETYVNVLPVMLDTVLDFSFHDIGKQNDLKTSEDLVAIAAEFLAAHSADPRVVVASAKDALLQALGTLTCHEQGIRALERVTNESQLLMGHALLRAYQNRAWGQSNWLLLRFWLGDGFAYRESRPTSVWQGGHKDVPLGLYRSRGKNGTHTGLLHHIAPASPSGHYQRLFRQILLTDEPFCTMFINSVLSQLNWAFSEFITLLQEIQAASQRQGTNTSQPAQVVIEPRQLKICAMCFELTVSLMRTLEMVLQIVPEVVQNTSRANSDVLLGRIVQLVSQVLSRVTIPPGCFQYIVDLCLPDLNSVSHFSSITAALGIVLALMKDEILEDDYIGRIPRISKYLLTEPSFQIGSLEFTLGDVKTPLQVSADASVSSSSLALEDSQVPRGNLIAAANETQSMRILKPDPPILPFSLKDYPLHIRADEIERVRRLIRTLQMRQSMMSEITILSEDSICPICYAKAISAEFYPCKHQSCSNCIVQHLLNTKVCFYCKTLILMVKAFDGTVLYENKVDGKVGSGPLTPAMSPSH